MRGGLGVPGRPGDRLRAFASRVCFAPVMERLIDPVIADLQSEHSEALRRGHVWRSRWIRIVGSIAFWKVVGLYSINRAGPLAKDWIARDDHALGRTLVFFTVWTAIAIAFFVWAPLQNFVWRVTPTEAALMTLYLIPSAITVAVPLALALGTLCGLRGRSVSIRTQRSLVVAAALLSVVMFVVLGWILPDANQAFRNQAFGVLVHNGRVPRGLNELTLGQLAAGGYWFKFHERCALSVSTLVLALFACTASRRMSGRWRSIAAGIPAVSVWLFLDLQGSGARPIDAWTPNLILAVLTALMVRLSPGNALQPR